MGRILPPIIIQKFPAHLPLSLCNSNITLRGIIGVKTIDQVKILIW